MAVLETLFSDWGRETAGVVGLGAVVFAPTGHLAMGTVVQPVVTKSDHTTCVHRTGSVA